MLNCSLLKKNRQQSVWLLDKNCQITIIISVVMLLFKEEVELNRPYYQEANNTHHETGADMEPSGHKENVNAKKRLV